VTDLFLLVVLTN